MRIGGATAVSLTHRAALLLKMRRPCAAIRDCSAAIKVNPNILAAYRLRGIAHRKLGNWRKAQRDLGEAQSLNWDEQTAEVHKFVTEKITGRPAAPKARPVDKSSPQAPRIPVRAPSPEKPYSKPVDPPRDLDKGQAVFVCGLVKAPHLNGKRGVVQRADPRPAQRGRWEVEVRLDDGKQEVKSLKGENIMTLNKADKIACRAWMREEKKHLELVKQKEAAEEEQWRKKRLEAKMSKMALDEPAKGLLRQLAEDAALEILEKASDGSDITNVSKFVSSQARMKLGFADSSDEEEEENEAEEFDPERLPEDQPPFPPIAKPVEEPTEAQLVATARAKKDAAKASDKSDFATALKKYTDAITAGGAKALLLAKRGELLLKLKRPRAAINDCSYAIDMNPDCVKAYHVRGMAHRTLGNWEDANDDLSHGQKLDFDESIVAVHNLVALKVNSLQERGIKRRRTSE